MFIKGRFYPLQDEEGKEAKTGGSDVKDKPADPPPIDPKEYKSLLESVRRLEDNNKKLLDEKIATERAAEQARMDAAKKSGDVESIEKSWSEKFQSSEAARMELENNYQSIIKNITIESTASRLASELALPGSAEVLEPHIQRRLGLEIRDGKVHQFVLDRDGKRSAMSLKELQAEIVSTPAFAPIIRGTQAKGSGYAGSPWSGEDGAKTVSRDKFMGMSERQRTDFIGKGGRVVDN